MVYRYLNLQMTLVVSMLVMSNLLLLVMSGKEGVCDMVDNWLGVGAMVECVAVAFLDFCFCH